MPSGDGERNGPRACIHVDLDSVWAMAGSFGLDIAPDPDPVLHTGIGNFLELFEEHGVKATFFLTGRDAANPRNARLIAAIAGAGHEIANHSMNHRPNFTTLGAAELEAEILDSHRVIEDVTGRGCVGFRAPTYNVNGDILRLLQRNGYLYDSSLLPTLISPLYRTVSFFSYRKSLAYGSLRHGTAPLAPYRPDAARPWRRGGMTIVEVPISTMPLFRLPFHCSYVFQTGLPLFGIGEFLARAAGGPLVYLFHARELAGEGGDWAAALPFRELPYARRRATVGRILKVITERFTVATTLDLVAAVPEEQT